jgi:hypothetical protein
MLKSKYSRYGVYSVLALTMLAYVMLRQDSVKTQAERLMQMNQHVITLEEKAASVEMENHRLVDENVALMSENARLRDTIAILRNELTNLQSLFGDQQNRISGYEKQMSANKLKIQKLQAEIQRMKGDSPAIVAAKKEKVEMIMEAQQANTQLEGQRERTFEEMGKTESTIVFKELEELRMKQIDLIRNQTTVNYKLVECKQTRSGKPISELQDDGTNWVFTSVTFDMQNPEPGRLADETFRIKLIDTDTGMELPYLESNPAFNKSKGETKGFTFNYRENPVKTMYINLQAKPGRNYSARLYYVNDDQEYMVAGSEVKIIANGKVVGM